MIFVNIIDYSVQMFGMYSIQSGLMRMPVCDRRGGGGRADDASSLLTGRLLEQYGEILFGSRENSRALFQLPSMHTIKYRLGHLDLFGSSLIDAG